MLITEVAAAGTTMIGVRDRLSEGRIKLKEGIMRVVRMLPDTKTGNSYLVVGTWERPPPSPRL